MRPRRRRGWVISLVAVCGLAACAPEPERDDITLSEASATITSEVKDVADRLGRVSNDVGGADSGCSDTLDERAGVMHAYRVTVAPRNLADPGSDVLAIASEWEERGWERSADGTTIELRKDFYEIEIEPADVPDRYAVSGFSPCVPDPDA